MHAPQFMHVLASCAFIKNGHLIFSFYHFKDSTISVCLRINEQCEIKGREQVAKVGRGEGEGRLRPLIMYSDNSFAVVLAHSSPS